MKFCFPIIIFFILTSFVAGDDPNFKLHKWTILDWKKSYYLDIPKLNYKDWIFWNESAKSIDIHYLDASIIDILVEPVGFDTLNSKYSLTDRVMKQEKLTCSKIIHTIDTIVNGDTTIFHGELSNGRLWKEKRFGRYKICYINVRKEQSKLYNISIDSFRDKK